MVLAPDLIFFGLEVFFNGFLNGFVIEAFVLPEFIIFCDQNSLDEVRGNFERGTHC